MDERQEIWLMTSLSIMVAVGSAHLVRYLFNILLLGIDATFESDGKYDRASLRNYVTRTKMLRNVFEFVNAAISSFMLIVGVYEKCILVAKDLWFEYYSTTLVLNVIYSYALQKASPNPLSCIIKHWDQLVHKEELVTEDSVNNNRTTSNMSVNLRSKPLHQGNGVRRRGGEASSVELNVPSEDLTVSKRRKPHDSVWTFFYFSGPTLLGQFLGLHTAIQWLHFAWDGFLTDHHVTSTGMLQKCLICLNTGPIQGLIIEASVTFFFAVFTKWLSSRPEDGPLGFVSRSFFVSACIQSVVVTAVLFIFIKVTGAFGNPLLAYVLERECLYDITVIVKHVIVYTVGGMIGVAMFKAVSPSKHWPIVLFIFLSFLSLYLFVPSILNKDLFSY